MTIAAAPTAPEPSAVFRRRLPDLVTDWEPTAVPRPELVAFNEELAAQLGIDPQWLRSPDGIATLAGNATLPGSTPVAMAYAGHQFGGFSPRLGDGRALLLGELTDTDGNLRDLHLKGSGRTPFARGGDGKATLGPMLREFLMAEAMHALGIPTARALAVVTTGEQVMRTGPEPGAVLTRVAESHIRVGTFQFAASRDPELVRPLLDYSIERHYPDLAHAENPADSFLSAVVESQASLIASWMLIGFIHGVMNTDNVLISGETVDYGPCAFLDAHDPRTVFSSIDHGGRYAYGNQPAIAQWNLARLAETLLPLIDGDQDRAIERATAVLNTYPDRYRHHWLVGMADKLALSATRPDEQTAALIDGLVELMVDHRADHTTTFRALANSLRGTTAPCEELLGRERFVAWFERWRGMLGDVDPVRVADRMDEVNPIYIPRNHLVDEALGAAVAGDMQPFADLLDIVTDPFDDRPGSGRYARPAPEDFTNRFKTYCGT